MNNQSHVYEEFIQTVVKDIEALVGPKADSKTIQSLLQEELQDHLFTTFIKHLDQEHAVQYIQLTEEGAEASEINEFLTTNIPNFEQTLYEALQGFKEEYLNKIKAKKV